MWLSLAFALSLACGALPLDLFIGIANPVFNGADRDFTLVFSGVQSIAVIGLAVKEINNKTDGVLDDVLPNATLRIIRRSNVDISVLAEEEILNSNCNENHGSCRGVLALLGPARSDDAKKVQNVAVQHQTPAMAFSATSTDLSNTTRYPFFSRTMPADGLQGAAQARLLQHFGWTCASTIAATDSYSAAGVKAFTAAAENLGVHVERSATFTNLQDVKATLQSLQRESACRLVVVWGQTPDEAAVLAAAAELNFYGPNVQFVVSEAFLEAGPAQLMRSLGNDVALAARVLQGVLVTFPSNGRGTPPYQALRERWLRQPPTTGNSSGSCSPLTDDDVHKPTYLYQEDHDNNRHTPAVCTGTDYSPATFIPFIPFAYDAVTALARALHGLVEDRGLLPCGDVALYRGWRDRTAADDGPCFTGADLQAAILNTSFAGVTGSVSFGPTNGDRAAAGVRYLVYQHPGLTDGGDKLAAFGVIGVADGDGFSGCVPPAPADCQEPVWSNGKRGLQNAPRVADPLPPPPGYIHPGSSPLLLTAVVAAIAGFAAVVLVLGTLLWFFDRYRLNRKLRKMLQADVSLVVALAEPGLRVHDHRAFAAAQATCKAACIRLNGALVTDGDCFVAMFRDLQHAAAYAGAVHQQLAQPQAEAVAVGLRAPSGRPRAVRLSVHVGRPQYEVRGCPARVVLTGDAMCVACGLCAGAAADGLVRVSAAAIDATSLAGTAGPGWCDERTFAVVSEPLPACGDCRHCKPLVSPWVPRGLGAGRRGRTIAREAATADAPLDRAPRAVATDQPGQASLSGPSSPGAGDAEDGLDPMAPQPRWADDLAQPQEAAQGQPPDASQATANRPSAQQPPTPDSLTSPTASVTAQDVLLDSPGQASPSRNQDPVSAMLSRMGHAGTPDYFHAYRELLRQLGGVAVALYAELPRHQAHQPAAPTDGADSQSLSTANTGTQYDAYRDAIARLGLAVGKQSVERLAAAAPADRERFAALARQYEDFVAEQQHREAQARRGTWYRAQAPPAEGAEPLGRVLVACSWKYEVRVHAGAAASEGDGGGLPSSAPSQLHSGSPAAFLTCLPAGERLTVEFRDPRTGALVKAEEVELAADGPARRVVEHPPRTGNSAP